MEEYRDLDLTITLFQKVLNEPRFFHLQAGSYCKALARFLQNAKKTSQSGRKERVKKGGAPIKLRIVKGANLPWKPLKVP